MCSGWVWCKERANLLTHVGRSLGGCTKWVSSWPICLLMLCDWLWCLRGGANLFLLADLAWDVLGLLQNRSWWGFSVEGK